MSETLVPPTRKKLNALGHTWTFTRRKGRSGHQVLMDGKTMFEASKLELDDDGVLWMEWTGASSTPESPKHYRKPVKLGAHT